MKAPTIRVPRAESLLLSAQLLLHVDCVCVTSEGNIGVVVHSDVLAIPSEDDWTVGSLNEGDGLLCLSNADNKKLCCYTHVDNRELDLEVGFDQRDYSCSITCYQHIINKHG